jgi:arylsulfatase A-like enzyme
VTIPLPALANDSAFQRLPEFVRKSEARMRWVSRFGTPDKAQANLRDYYRLIRGVDREVGRIVTELDKRGFAKNTVIILSADNGFALGDRGLTDKWFMYEESIRVPLIIIDPRVPLSAHQRDVESIALNVDVAPTILDLAELVAPATMQGRTLLPFLRGPAPTTPRTEFFYEHHYLPARIPPSEGVRTERWIVHSLAVTKSADGATL